MTSMQSILRILAVATLAATALLSQALHAQVSNHTSHVNVPFAFDCGNHHFAPGTYAITTTDMNLLSVVNRSQIGWAVFMSDNQSSASVPGVGYLIFRKYGNRYFLAEYHPAFSKSSAQIAKSKAERSAARDYAANKADAGHVRLALLEDSGDGSSGR